MTLPFSKTQIEKLGVRLIRGERPAPSDLAMLQSLLSAYSEILETAVARLSTGLDVAPTARVKNSGTILEKLERHGGSWLKSIQDLAGMRIVADTSREGQDRLVERVVDEFGDEVKVPRVIDRRISPSYGYTAVHVVVFPQGVPVEIQVRTRLQHEWAEMFEKLADRVGRGIRYGSSPDHWNRQTQAQLLDGALPQEHADALYAAAYKEREAVVELAIAVGEVIGAFEADEAEMSDDEILEYRRLIAEDLGSLRVKIEEYARPDID